MLRLSIIHLRMHPLMPYHRLLLGRLRRHGMIVRPRRLLNGVAFHAVGGRPVALEHNSLVCLDTGLAEALAIKPTCHFLLMVATAIADRGEDRAVLVSYRLTEEACADTIDLWLKLHLMCLVADWARAYLMFEIFKLVQVAGLLCVRLRRHQINLVVVLRRIDQ